MTHEEIVLKLNDCEHEIGSLKHRVKKLEEVHKLIYDLTLNVRELAISVQSMVEEQKEQGERIKKLEEQPAEKWNLLTKTIVTGVVSAIIGAVMSALFLL